jgi:CubicO group peptidase (beta-lactamase class C family)
MKPLFIFAGWAIGSLIAIAAWLVLVVLMAFEGFWMKPLVQQDNHAAFFAEAEQVIEDSNPGNTAFILVESGKIVGEHFSKEERGINEHTAFPTGSFSKWITALGVMSLVDQGLIDLDDPVSLHLTRWQLPESQYDEGAVTIRRLMSHTAGLTDGLGFGDYRGDEALPTLEQSLSTPRASSGRDAKIAIGAEPGQAFAYSGGGYLILQLLLEEASQQDYQTYIQQTILDPLGMKDSSFRFVGDIAGATKSYTADGDLAPQYQYASAAATGFVSSTDDLIRLVKAFISEDAALGIVPATLRSMRKPEASLYGASIWGLGTMLYAPTGSGDYIYGHDGANAPAINASVRINPDTGDAFIMLVNGHPSLASNIGSEWVLWQTGKPDFLSTERALRSAFWPGLIGGLIIFVLIIIIARRAKTARRKSERTTAER